MATTKKTTVAKTTAKKSTTTKAKPTIKQNTQISTSVEETKQVEVKSAPEKVTYNADTPIPCRSVTAGTMVYIGPKTGTPYTWVSENDVVYLEYQDVMSCIMSRSAYVMSPLFIIEDEKLVEDPRCVEIKKMYNSISGIDNIGQILSMSNDDFRRALTQSPAGIQESIKNEISLRVGNGTFDSVQKIRIVDEVLGTEIAKLLI